MVGSRMAVAAALGLLVQGCGTSRGPARDQGVSSGGGWRVSGAVAQAVAAEAPDLPVFEVSLPGVLEQPVVRLRSSVAPLLVGDGGGGAAHLRVRLGERAADCAVRSDRIDVAHAFFQAHAAVRGRAGPTRTRTGALQLVPGAGWPALWLRVEFLDERGAFGALHIAAANVRDHGVFCTLEAPGHTRTFLGLVEELTASLADALEDTAERRVLHAVVVDGATVGIAEEVGRSQDEGNHLDMAFAALVSVDGERLDARDDLEVEVTGAGGALALQRVMRQRNGTMERNLVLSPTGDSRRPFARGTWDGKEQTLQLGGLCPASGRQLRVHLARSSAVPSQPPQRFLRYHPGVDLGSLVEETVHWLGPVAGGARFRSELRSPGTTTDAEYDVDARGERLRTVVTGARGAVVLERLPLP